MNEQMQTESNSGKENRTMVICGERIALRPMEEGDTADIIRWRNTDFVRKNFIYQKPFTVETHQHWMETMVNTGKVVQFMICPYEESVEKEAGKVGQSQPEQIKDTGLKKCGNAVGSLYLRDINKTHHKAEYGIFIGEEAALSKGYGTEAAQLMLQYAFETLHLHKVMLRVLAENVRAQRSYEKAGFRKEAYLKDDVFLNGKYCDVILMACICDDSAAMQK